MWFALGPGLLDDSLMFVSFLVGPGAPPSDSVDLDLDPGQDSEMAKTHTARLTAGGPTWDLRAKRNPHGNPENRSTLPAKAKDAPAYVQRNLTWLTAALRDGREDTARELLKESRFLIRKFPAQFDETVRRKLEAAATLLRSPAWKAHAAERRHGGAGASGIRSR
ncbi:hypothetical protein OIE73_28625 [Streptomyces hirsutus]|uniref:Uncharacterized protein n=1 Tax=Streptomyces hirsutus TaxID=35620 RepID=A0ABZ1GSZ2_9ACTN|nr:hypothetical protein [Streptomyces hirsutus]WSD09312.1 hypothetical protein OIE73_28625 [Streptomyces hirsutus]